MPELKADTPIQYLKGVGPKMAKKLAKINIKTAWDLLTYFPFRYQNYGLVTPIEKLQEGEAVTIVGEIRQISNQYTRSKKQIQKAVVEDSTGQLLVSWFNQPFLLRFLRKNIVVSLSGKIQKYNSKLTLVSPDYELIRPGQATIHTGRLVPVYSETSGISSKYLRKLITNLLPLIKEEIKEVLPVKIIIDQKLLPRKEAFLKVHFPESKLAAKKARHRLAFEELFFLQLKILKRKRAREKEQKSFAWKIGDKKLEKKIKEFKKSFPFLLTASQQKAGKEIIASLKKEFCVQHLLCGDVGSGKTVVAALAAYAVLLNGHSVAFLAPTEILSFQHYQTLKKIFSPFNIPVELITSSQKIRKRGRAKIILGTHALLHEKTINNLGLVIIDEQQRFGVKQRSRLLAKGKEDFYPHSLIMTATPIPRTIAQTLYGDLEVSILTDQPPGRRKVATFIIAKKDRKKCYVWLKKEIKKNKIQAFIICPLIEPSETLKTVKAANKEFATLQKNIFPELKLCLLHGRMKGKEKEEILHKMQKRKIDILVTTPVVEVGIDLPYAAVMIIEAADRFGLSALHQLRGRIGRGEHKSYCFLFSEEPGKKAQKRLKALTRYHQGLKLAKLDLKWRGPGEMFGLKQHGFLKLKIANFNDLPLLAAAKREACKLADKSVK
ncbi:MAG: ATP-dependent DNA helicase RecG [Candidatus Shapirobacteria bacterium]